MNGQTAVILGATGLIGSALLQQLLEDPAFSRIRVLARRPLELTHPKLEVCITNFSDYNDYQTKLGTGDCIFCSIGTTMAQVKGDKLLYRTIDFDIPVNAARFGKSAGFQQYLLVSAVGANPRSNVFYSRLKGEVEEVIATYKFNGFHIFRPSILVGNRKEQRTGEKIGKFIFQTFSFLIPSKYKSIEAIKVAAAMIAIAKQNIKGAKVYYYQEMMQLEHKL